MAHIKISILGEKLNPSDRFSTRKVLKCVEVIGRKMPSKWMAEHYGKYWKQDFFAMYYVKSHKYGVRWVLDSRYYDEHHYNMACDGDFFPDGIVRISIK